MARNFDLSWDFTVKVPMKGEEKSVVAFKCEDGETVTGYMDSGDHGKQDILEGTWDGTNLIWKSQVEKPMKLKLTYTSTLDDDNNMTGFLKVAMAKMKFTGVPK